MKTLTSFLFIFTFLFAFWFVSYKLTWQDFLKDNDMIFITFLVSLLINKLENIHENSNAFYFYMEDKMDEFIK